MTALSPAENRDEEIVIKAIHHTSAGTTCSDGRPRTAGLRRGVGAVAHACQIARGLTGDSGESTADARRLEHRYAAGQCGSNPQKTQASQAEASAKSPAVTRGFVRPTLSPTDRQRVVSEADVS